MITLPPSLDSLMVQSGTTKKVICYRMTRTDGTIYRFTTANHNITFGGETFETMGGGVDPSNRRKEIGLSGHSIETQGYIDSASITEEDIIAGKFRNCKVEEYIVHPMFPWVDQQKISQYVLGEMSFTGHSWNADLKSLTSQLKQKTGNTFQVLCNNSFGDTQCAIVKATWTITPVTVSGVSDRSAFDAVDVDIGSTLAGKTIADDFFNDGEVIWLTGDNAGITSRVASYVHTDRVFGLYQSAPFTIQAGDTFTLIRGCNKILDEDCYDIYDNVENMDAHPWMPGPDKEFQTPPA